ncbi:MAG: putative hybrid sensor histidine [Ignavibacteria bacterium]|nr:MAG: putative hybrid sensor histidine [Ignavibacteria bacterium]
MNAFSIIPIVALLFNGAVWSYIFINRKERPVNNSFLLYSTNLMLWIIVEIILRQPLSTEYIMPLIKIDSIMSLAPTFWFLNFTYTFIGRKRDLIYYISSTSVFTIILVSISTNLILADYLKTSWGYDRVQGVLYFPAIIIAIILPALYSVYLIIEKIKTTSDYTYKKSLPLILIGSLISLMLGLVSNVIIPHIFNNHDLVQFGESTTVVQSYFILVAVIKYKLFTPSVEDIANDLFSSMKEAVLILDKEGKILQLNAYAKKLFGSKVAGNEEVINVNNLFSNYEINKDVTDYEVNYMSDSEKKILSLSQIGIINKDVELGKILIARDVTERKRAEEALSESEAKFRWLFENVPDGIYLSTPDGKLVNVNDTLVQMLGYNSKEELLAADIVNELYMNPSERTFWIGKLEVNGKLHSIELHLKRKDGTPLLVRENAHLLADESGKLFYEGTLTDITKLKEAEKALRSSEIRFRSVWESSAEGMRLTDKDGIIIAVNKAFCKLTEMKAQDLMEQPLTVTYNGGKNKDAMLQNYRTRFNEKSFPTNLEQKLILPSGKVVYLDGTYTFVEIESGNALLLSVFRDVTERILNEQALKKNKLMMNRAEEIAHLGSWELDSETNKLNCSAELYQIYGLQPENFDGKFESILKLVHPEDSGNILANIKRARESNEPFEHYERIIRPDGENRILYTKGIVLDDIEGNAKTIYGSCLDVTEFKRVENALINSSEKLRALSASLEAAREEERSYIARELHDELGQVLTAIKMDLTLMQDDLLIKQDLLKKDITEQLVQIEKMVDRLIITVKNIATELRPDILDHLGLIAALEWHAKEFENRHKVRCVFNSNIGKIELGKEKSTAVFRIFQETLTNVARHSGASRITAKIQLLEDKLLLEVEDNGKGISNEQLFNISSIGITGMKERAKFLGGKVFIDGQEGKGTKVFLEMPLSHAEDLNKI